MFSVVIPLYNKELSIINTIQSVLDQTFQNFEIVVVNDGSTDRSVEMVEQFNDPRIRIINKSNGGVSSARNRGIQEAKYELVAFLDADDFWEPEYLYEMIKLIKEFPQAAIWGCSYDFYSNDNYHNNNNIELDPFYRKEILNYFEMAKTDMLFWSSAVIINKSKAIKIGGFDERISIGEDLDMWLRLILNYPPPVYYNKILTHYNLDAPNRAMNRKHNYSNSFLFYIDKFKHWRKLNNDFAEFINLYLCFSFIYLFTYYDTNKKIIKNHKNKIDSKYISLKWKIYLKLPYLLKKILAHLHVKKRQ
jgi:glycosyltransferase involved in cell wall biosynthesis